MSVPTIEDQGGVVRFVEADDGARLRTASFPSRGAGEGQLLFLTGFSEFIEKHLETIADFQKRGFAVWTMDWRGQGLSDRALDNRDKGHVVDFKHFLDDLDIVLAETVPHRPLTLVGHSMGGHLALRLAHDRPARVARAVLIAPMIELVLPPFTHGFAHLAAIGLSMLGLDDHYIPGARDYGPWREVFEGNNLTSDRRRFMVAVEQVRANRALGISGPTYGWLRSAFRSMAEIRSYGYAEGINAPTLIVGAGRDSLVDTEAARALVHRLPYGRFAMIEEALHEILHERDDLRNRFWQRFDAFVAETGEDDGNEAQG
ncbi:MAG: alpha/beta hydrolase [Alphaproteobacteria bacterium]|nr:alpha/beta hydrolase [Alphaproteobacteria bacterium]